jgi:alpha-tubulin suppressor-like RCC1 family protein
MRTPRHAMPIVALAILAACLFLRTSAQASVSGGGLKIRWFGEKPQAAQAGQEFVGHVEIIAAKPGSLDQLEVVGQGWSLRSSDAPAHASMGRGEQRVLNFRAVPSDPTQPLTVRAVFNGVPVERSGRFDAHSLEKRKLQYQNGQGPKLSGARPKLAPGSTERAQNQDIAFMGDFKYTRTDGTVRGADHIQIKVWDEDAVFDELMWSGTTDTQGHFEGAVSWDDCDISGCDDPDIYVEVIATGDACDLQEDSLLEETYSWESAVTNNFTGTFIDFGTLTPGTQTPDNAACHVFTSVTRAHRFASDRAGMNAPPVDVQFPDGGTTSRYDTFYNEIHITANDMWDELTQTHEFGHHLHYTFGNLLDPDYENGFCDDPTPGHCVWCPEHVGEGWQEGFADWYGQLVTEDYITSYGQIPWVENNQGPLFLYKNDGVAACGDGMTYNDSRTEGFVMALLRDMQDGTNDNHSNDPAPDCSRDAMSIGYDEILQVFKDDDPTDMGMFLNDFRARYPQFDMDLYSTTMNVGPTFSFPLPDPKVVTQPSPCVIARTGETITLHVDGNGSLLTYQWRANGGNLVNDPNTHGVATNTLTLSPVASWMTATYDCVVKTCDGSKSVTSASTRITVFSAPPTPARPYVSWGENYGGQCGNGTNTYQLPAGNYTGLTNIIQVEGGRTFTMALKSDGSVYDWGQANTGELGNGFYGSNLYTPFQVGITNVLQIAAGNNFDLALKRDGTIWGWGNNFYGQLGDSTQNDQNTPHSTKFPGCFVAIAGGYSHTLALRSDGTVWVCGYNGLGSLGLGTTNAVNTYPTQVPGLTGVVAISAAGYSSYALKSDGTVWSWGYNAFGNLGDGTSTQRNSPVQVSGLTGIKSIASSYYNGYAISSTGQAYAWGRGDYGAIGNGSSAYQYTPALIPAIVNPRKIVTGDAMWAMALMQDNTLRAWGYNVNSVLGTGAPDGSLQYSPQNVPGVIGVNDIGAGTATAHVMGLVVSPTGVETETVPPLELALRITPMPARADVGIAFDLPAAGRASISVYDVSGRLVRSIVSDTRPAGHNAVRWDGRSRSGEMAAAGVYFARLEHLGNVLTRRIVLVR